MSNSDQQDKPREQPRMMQHGPGRMGTVEKAKDPRGAFRRLMGYLGAYKGQIALAVAFTTVGTFLTLAGPYLIGIAIDQYIQFYNEQRYQEKLKGLTPMEFRNQALKIESTI